MTPPDAANRDQVFADIADRLSALAREAGELQSVISQVAGNVDDGIAEAAKTIGIPFCWPVPERKGVYLIVERFYKSCAPNADDRWHVLVGICICKPECRHLKEVSNDAWTYLQPLRETSMGHKIIVFPHLKAFIVAYADAAEKHIRELVRLEPEFRIVEEIAKSLRGSFDVESKKWGMRRGITTFFFDASGVL